MKLLAACVLAFHLAWILWVIFGALCTRGRPWLTAFHIASLIWGMIAEAGPWPCPLTLAENWCETQAGIQPYSGGFLVHYLDRIVYPNISVAFLIWSAIVVCAINLAVYLTRLVRSLRNRALPRPSS